MNPSSVVRELHEIRLVGRGGTGVVTAGELLGKAAVLEGKWAQAIPTFGPERRGALCTSTLRLSDEPIRLKCSTARPDVLVVLDATIWRHAPVLGGLEEGATLIFNSAAAPAKLDGELGLALERYALHTVDATGIALECLQRAITNTAMLGALAGATGLVGMEAVEAVIRERFGAAAEANIAAARFGRARVRGR
ncbi:MAG: 2-oxoacid:acceptor oxidoreductase family protein [Planctomycetota bacterium]|jgi:2-oxoacid:acceptor oxidoreductase gamma subunit (pyruvate/2-ketoisovalerate family)